MIKTRFLGVAGVIAAIACWPLHGRAAADLLASVPAQMAPASASGGFDGVVEAVRQAAVSAQVAGAVVELDVKAGDFVKAGQMLLRIDARAADQSASAVDAQVRAARASMQASTLEYERQKQLFEKNYISQAALERAESAFKTARAQVAAQEAQAGAARTESGLHVVRAPFSGVVADLPVSLGDMAMPGRRLLTIYDPGALRVTAAVPQSLAEQVGADRPPRIELPDRPAGRQWPPVGSVQLLPTVDPLTHTMALRVRLEGAEAGVVPGMFARVWLGLNGAAGAAGKSVSVPVGAVVRHAELTAVYVLDSSGRPNLRQVRLGRGDAERVEVLAGLRPGERVVTDPQAAARLR